MKINYSTFATVMMVALVTALTLIMLVIFISMTSTLVHGNPANPAQILSSERSSLISPSDDTLPPPHNLFVNDVSLKATWDSPDILLDEDFETTSFPPYNWQSTTLGYGWALGNNGGNSAFTIPAHGIYAFINDNAAGPANNGCCDILITPPVDLTNATVNTLTFESYFTGIGSQVASVEISTNQGATWITITTLLPASGWVTVSIDLSAYSGLSGAADARIAFHTADNYNQASGWAIDDIKITSTVQNVLGYKVFLDGIFYATTDTTTYTYNPDSIPFGSYHLAAVNAVYTTGNSVQDTFGFNSHYLYPPLNLTAASIENAVLFSWDNSVGTDGLPLPNLLGYDLYLDDIFITYVEPDTVNQYWLLNQIYGTYCLDVTAIYDLTLYGYTGTAESIKAGPACAEICCLPLLPFIEGWHTGSFATNQWTADTNWIIAGQMGNPMPCAEFNWNPPQTDYAYALESYFMDAQTSTTTPYKLWLDFDLALHDRNATSAEMLSAEVWDGLTWVPVGWYSNTGDRPFTTEHIDITAQAKERVFKIRFRAGGASSADIYYWLVDNIKVYVGYEFLPPTNLVTYVHYYPDAFIHLSWQAPAGSVILPGEWIHYDNGVNADAIGTGGAADFDIAIRYTPAQLAQYEGNAVAVKKIRFFPNEPACEYSVRIWTGINAANLIVDQPVSSPSIGSWNEVELSTSAPIDVSQELWIGVRCNAGTGYPAGCDAGPAVAGYGDLITLDGILWESISQVYGLDFNWNLQAFVEGIGDSELISLMPIKRTSALTTTTETLKLDPNYTKAYNKKLRSIKDLKQSNNNRGLTGYNIYRINCNWMSDTIVIHNISSTEYDDPIIIIPDIYECYEYYVTAVYPEGESVRSNIEIELVPYDNIIESTPTPITIFPNPSTTSLTIGYSGPIAGISVYNLLGLKISESRSPGTQTVQLNTSGYPPGTYLLHITAADGSAFHRSFVVVK
jgi:hypothetical protein